MDPRYGTPWHAMARNGTHGSIVRKAYARRLQEVETFMQRRDLASILQLSHTVLTPTEIDGGILPQPRHTAQLGSPFQPFHHPSCSSMAQGRVWHSVIHF